MPLAVAETMDDNKILFTFNSDQTAEAMKDMDERLKVMKEVIKKYKEDDEPEPDDELEFDIDFEPDFDPDKVN